jgi:hypothetical protein
VTLTDGLGLWHGLVNGATGHDCVFVHLRVWNFHLSRKSSSSCGRVGLFAYCEEEGALRGSSVGAVDARHFCECGKEEGGRRSNGEDEDGWRGNCKAETQKFSGQQSESFWWKTRDEYIEQPRSVVQFGGSHTTAR